MSVAMSDADGRKVRVGFARVWVKRSWTLAQALYSAPDGRDRGALAARAEAAVTTVEAILREGAATPLELAMGEGVFAVIAGLAPEAEGHDMVLARELLARLGDRADAIATMSKVMRLARDGRHDEANALRRGPPLT
jgi:hypothetical protein